MKLYTIPYAGGFSFTYQKWRKFLDKGIELHPIEYPGRGRRFKESMCQTIEQMADNVMNQIVTEEEEYALFGHSMGAYVLLELYSRIYRSNKSLPKHVIISAMNPPHLYNPKGYHLLDNDQFQTKMCEMGGIPPTITQDAEFSEYMFSLLMNDFKAVEDYKTTDDMPLISCDISLFSSESDISYDNMMQWNQYSSMSCSYYEFEGSHFFINEYVFETVSTINHILRF